jgi:hypothetical protein
MSPARPGRLLVALALLTLVLVPPPAPASSTKPKPAASGPAFAPCEPLAGPAPDAPRERATRVGLNFSADMLTSSDSANVQVCALVDSLGIVRQARVERGGTPYDSAAVDAVHWWQFEPARAHGRPVAARVSVAVPVHPPVDADPLTPDVLRHGAQGRGGRGSPRRPGCLDRHAGESGRHPTLGNEWVIRERILRLAAGLGAAPAVPSGAVSSARGAHNLMLRDVSRATNADLAKALDAVLLEAPWYADAYRWRASARAASGQRAGAIRDVLCYEIATRDSARLAMADRALVALATGDTLAALTMLKHGVAAWGTPRSGVQLSPLHEHRHPHAAAHAQRGEAVAPFTRESSCTSSTRMRVPLMPVGWPSAMPPPFGFSLSWSSLELAVARQHL